MELAYLFWKKKCAKLKPACDKAMRNLFDPEGAYKYLSE